MASPGQISFVSFLDNASTVEYEIQSVDILVDPAMMGMPVPHPAMAMGRGAVGMGIPMGRPAMAMMGMPTSRRHHYAGLMGGGNVSGMDSRLATILAMCAGAYPGMEMYSSGHSRRGRRCYDDLDLEFERDPYFMFDDSWWDPYEDDDVDECDDPILLVERGMRRLKRGRGRCGRRGTAFAIK